MSTSNSRIRATLTLLLLISALALSGCSGRSGLSVVDYATVKTSKPPQSLTGRWSGPHAGGTLFIEVFAEGNLRGCLSAPPYYHEMKGKYSRQALYFEDGSRLQIRSAGNHQLVIESPPGIYAATLKATGTDTEALRCFSTAARIAQSISAAGATGR
jgi:hypothetical protein